MQVIRRITRKVLKIQESNYLLTVDSKGNKLLKNRHNYDHLVQIYHTYAAEHNKARYSLLLTIFPCKVQ